MYVGRPRIDQLSGYIHHCVSCSRMEYFTNSWTTTVWVETLTHVVGYHCLYPLSLISMRREGGATAAALGGRGGYVRRKHTVHTQQ